MAEHYAVIDLGTNTFHLLLVQSNPGGGFSEVHRERIFVKLAEDGIATIGAKAYKRGLDALVRYQQILSKHPNTKVKAIGTAALRTASNGPKFIKEVFEKTNIVVQLIDGKKEAELIHLGVDMAVQLDDNNALIMDIGGGSVEFIIANKNSVKWANSFPVGVAVLFKSFHQEDPISEKEIVALNAYLEKSLQPLFTALIEHPVKKLVGASGTFDVLENILAEKRINKTSAQVSIQAFHTLFKQLISTTLLERKALETIPEDRVDMIIVALLLIKFVISKAKNTDILVSSFALKEGVLKQMILESNK